MSVGILIHLRESEVEVSKVVIDSCLGAQSGRLPFVASGDHVRFKMATD